MSLDDLAAQLGPLPKSDDNARLQRESIKALNRLLLGIDDLIFRDERIEDYGVDGSFELKIAAQMTNCRAQVQMKGSAHVKITGEGYVPLQVASANLNYLLNGSSPIYILWDETTDEIRYVWAQEENRRLYTENPSWKQQESITLRFRHRLTREVIPSIAARILREARLQREIRDRLARATEADPVVLQINADSLQITDAAVAKSLLLASGTTIVAAGFPQQVLDLMRLVDTTTQDLPRMELTAGYAEYMLGNHWKAIGHFRRAIARGSELSTRDYSFLENIRDASELHIGLIDSAKYEERVNVRARKLTGLEALEAEQDTLFRRCVRETDLARRTELAKDLRVVTERILKEPHTPGTIKLQAKLLLLTTLCFSTGSGRTKRWKHRTTICNALT